MRISKATTIGAAIVVFVAAVAYFGTFPSGEDLRRASRGADRLGRLESIKLAGSGLVHGESLATILGDFAKAGEK